MGKYRDDWRDAKATAEKTKDFVFSDEMKKLDLGPTLDKFEAAVKAYHDNHDGNKTEKLAEAVSDELEKANGPLTLYKNALKGIQKARPQQAAAAAKLHQVLSKIASDMARALAPSSRDTFREIWRAAKAEAERDKSFVLSEECKKTDLGPHLDKFQAAIKSFNDNEDEGKKEKLKQACLDELKKTNDAMRVYINALLGIEKARPQQAEAAKRLNQILSGVANSITNEMTLVVGRKVR